MSARKTDGLRNYVVIDHAERIVAAFDDGNAAISYREKREPKRFAWSVITSGQAALAGLAWHDGHTEREFTSEAARVVITHDTRDDRVWLRIIELDGKDGEGYAEAWMTAHQFRLIAEAVPPTDWAGER